MQGCQCSGCTSFAALAASTGQTTPDPIQPAQQIATSLAKEAQPAVADWVQQIEAMLSQANDLTAFKAMLLDSFDRLPPDQFAQAIALGIEAAQTAGRYDVVQTSG